MRSKNGIILEAKYAKQNGIILEAKYAKQNGGWGMLLEAKWNASRSKIYLSTKQNIARKWNHS